MTVRFKPSSPCPICGGWESDRLRGTHRRCWGFISDDRRFAFCTRAEHSGGLLMSAGCGAYRHTLDGDCKCGSSHGAKPPSPDLRGPYTRNGRDGGHLGTPVAAHVYLDSKRHPVHRTVRFREPKGFRQQRFVNGEWVWGVKGHPRILYNLPEIVEAETIQPIFITEGEKDADSIIRLGYLATTNSDGAGVWRREYNHWLRGRDVIIVEDADAAGRERTNLLVKELSSKVKRLRVAWFPNQEDGYDISDYIAERHGLDGLSAAMYDTGASKIIRRKVAS